MKLSKMTKYTLFSTVASLLLRGIGLAFNVFLTNRIGAQGIGLMTIITSVYGLGVTFSASGYRLATTRLAVEDESSDAPNARALMSRIVSLAVLTGSIFGAVLYFASGSISEKILSEPVCADALRILSFTLPMLAVSGVVTAYLNAFFKVVHTAVLQAVSQIIQIIFVVSVLPSYVGDLAACTRIIALGSVAGETICLIVSVVMLIKLIAKKKQVKSKKPFLKPFLRIALPDALGYDLRSALSTIQHMLIPLGLKKSGASSAAALATYGVLHGMALQVILFPSCILRSLATLLVPTVTDSRSRGDKSGTLVTVRRVLHLTLVFSLGTACVMFFCSDAISYALYENYDCAGFLRLFAPLIPIMYLDISIDSMLKGLDKQVASMGYNLLDSIVSVIMIWLLIPRFAVNGYIVTVFVTETLNTSLSLRKLMVSSGVKIKLFDDIISPLMCVLGAGSAGALISSFIHLGHDRVSLLFRIVITLGIYVSLAMLMSSETRENVYMMFRIKKSNKDRKFVIGFNK